MFENQLAKILRELNPMEVVGTMELYRPYKLILRVFAEGASVADDYREGDDPLPEEVEDHELEELFEGEWWTHENPNVGEQILLENSQAFQCPQGMDSCIGIRVLAGHFL